MLAFNLSRVLSLRGIDKPYAFLVNLGFHRTIASNLVNNRAVNIKVAHLEKLCRTLNCTPSDLFEWTADADNTLGERHSLNSLKRSKSGKRLSQIIKDIPVEKLGEIEGLLNQLKDQV